MALDVDYAVLPGARDEGGVQLRRGGVEGDVCYGAVLRLRVAGVEGALVNGVVKRLDLAPVSLSHGLNAAAVKHPAEDLPAEVKAIVDGLRSDPKAQKDLEKGLNEDYDEVVKKLREQLPKIKEEDILLFCFSASGFSSTTISTLLEKDKPYVYNRLYRLKSRISSSDAPDKELFLSLL